jgi:glycosyltransferase involved in cell wall biosynthesis
MRILMLSDMYPPIVGGLEQYVRRLSRELAARGHAVTVATLAHGTAPAFERDGDVRLYRLRGAVHQATWLYGDAARIQAPPLPDPLLTRALWRVLAEEQPEIVHAHNWLVHSFLPLKRASGAKLVVTLHDFGLVCAKKSLYHQGGICTGPAPVKCLGCASAHYGPVRGAATIGGLALMAPLERAGVDLFLATGRRTAELNRLHRSSVRFEVVPNFVSDEPARPVGHDQAGYLRRLPSEPYLLFVGALGRHKGVHVLLDAYRGLVDPPPLVVIGASSTEASFDYPRGTTVLTDWPHAAVLRAWDRCLFGIVPSTWADPFPTVTLEAMAAGKAVVGTSAGGLVDMIDHGVTGLLVPPADAEALRAAMAYLIEEPATRSTMGEAARRKVRGFTAQAVVPRLEQAYRALLAPPGASQELVTVSART